MILISTPWPRMLRKPRSREALAAAVDDDDLRPFERLLDVVAEPFTERLSDVRYAHPAPPEFTAGYRTFCGT